MRYLVWLIAASVGLAVAGGCVYHDHPHHDDVIVEGHEHEHWVKDHWEHDADWDQYHHDDHP